MKSFNELDLPEVLHKALEKMKFTTPTPIQAKAIPLALEGKDVIGSAQTGTGKTAAFSIPMMKTLLENDKAVALVLVPTRELAEQVWKVVKDLAHFTPQIKPALIIGGVSMRQQLNALRAHPRVIIATPGRLIDHLGQKTANLSHAHFLVLDEADRMLDMGFASQLERILKHLPAKRQSVLFSATIPPNILALSKKFLTNPAQVSVGETNQAATTIDQRVLRVAADKKNDALLDEVNARQGSILVFARTKHRTDKIFKFLTSYGVKVDRIHGNRSQGQRTKAIADLRSEAIRVLVATDIAARGLDVSAVTNVINYDLPMDPEDYVHRIGRTGRAGRSGEALSFVTNEDRELWKSIERLLTKSSKTGVMPAMTEHASFTGRDRVSHESGDAPQREARPDRRHGRKPTGGGRPSARPSRGGPGGPKRRDERSASGGRPERSASAGRPERGASGSRPGGPRPERSGSRTERSERGPREEYRGARGADGPRGRDDRRERDERHVEDARGAKRLRPGTRPEKAASSSRPGPKAAAHATKKGSKFGQFMDRFKSSRAQK